jgi:5-amino-6-(5-phospho-D-ribitylamino)uracil phosphatase
MRILFATATARREPPQTILILFRRFHGHGGSRKQRASRKFIPCSIAAAVTIAAMPRPAHKIRLIAVDLDGTLLTSAKRIGERSLRALRAAHHEAGSAVVLASARPPRSVMPFYDQLGLDTPMVNYNGALVYDPASRRILLHLPIPVATAHGVIRLAREHLPEIAVSAEILDRWYTDRLDERYVVETARFFQPDRVAEIGEWLTEPVTKLLLLGPGDALTGLAAKIEAAWAGHVSMVHMDEHLIQVMHAAASKVEALQTIAAERGVKRQEVMAIGDNANDVGMLRWAGLGVAVGNATPDALAAARAVTGSNDDEGVADAVERHVLGR